MAEQIQLHLTEQEQLIQATSRIALSASTISTKMASVTEGIPNLSSQGMFHDHIGSTDSHGTLGQFVLKAREFQTVCELLETHTQRTYDTMVNADKMEAIKVANLMLNSSEVSEEDKQVLREHPEESLAWIQKQMKEQGGK